MCKKYSTDDFIKLSEKVHQNKYDYSKVEYVNAKTKVCIVCPEHGEFWQTPDSHLKGKGCKKCGFIKSQNSKKITTEKFIEKAKLTHGDKYDYSKVEYVNAKTKVCIICPEHGEFFINPSHFRNGKGCSKCASKTRWDKRGRVTTQKFIKKAKEKYKELYDYSKVEYVNAKTKVCIICPEHGEFWQTPNKHFNGQGCPFCANIKNASEYKLYNLLKNKYPNKNIIKQYYNKDIFGKKRIDFFIEEDKIAIEYQGMQHFKPIDFFGGDKEFLKLQKRDKIKHKECLQNSITLLYFSFEKNEYTQNYIDKVYNNIQDLYKAIDVCINKKRE